MQDLIVIPARYDSTRLPGKPLIEITGQSLLERVSKIALKAAGTIGDVTTVVATDNERIEKHALELGLDCVMTDAAIASGSDRAFAAANLVGFQPGFVLNLQGDAPFASPEHVCAILSRARASNLEVTTPVVRLSWDELDIFRARKLETPFSGTTCVRSEEGKAYWFSKSILPVIRKEESLRKASEHSPVLQHIGMYCYRLDILEKFTQLAESSYEKLEGLEQLRLLENGIPVHVVEVSPAKITMSGIDNPQDVTRAEELINKYGDPNDS